MALIVAFYADMFRDLANGLESGAAHWYSCGLIAAVPASIAGVIISGRRLIRARRAQ